MPGFNYIIPLQKYFMAILFKIFNFPQIRSYYFLRLLDSNGLNVIPSGDRDDNNGSKTHKTTP
jgi:hypothetical protein